MSGAVEDKLMSLAARKFNKSPADFRPEDDFFKKLGINSFQAMSLLTALEETFGVEIPDYELAGVTTFAALADVIRRRL